MIYGIGTDIVQVSRIAQIVAQGDRFAERVLGPDEMQVYQERRARHEGRGIRYLATRFAAKEAYSKALGIGISDEMRWHAAQILNDARGKPYLAFNGGLEAFMREQGLAAHVSVSDEMDYVVAFVTLERQP